MTILEIITGKKPSLSFEVFPPKKDEDYEKVAANYPEILKIANRYYDMIFVDLTRKMDTKQAKDILDISDVVIMNITQRLRTID